MYTICHIYVYISVYIVYARVFETLGKAVCKYACMYVWIPFASEFPMYTYIYVCFVFVSMHECVSCVCNYVCIYVCTYICVYIICVHEYSM